MRVSVITTLYNYSNYIGCAIKSFLSQEFSDSEMIVVDDASKDNPYPVIKRMLSEKVRYIKLDHNSGYSVAKNVGIRESSSEIIVMLDADDYLLPDSLKIRFNKINEGFDFVHGPALDLKNNNMVLSKLWKQWVKSKKDSSCYKHVHAQGVMLRKQIHREIGLYDKNLRSKSDREMWARIFNHHYKIGFVDQPVVVYRMHEKQMHKSKEKMTVNNFLQQQVLSKIESRKTDLSGLEMLH